MISIVTAWSNDQQPLADLTIPNRIEYCKIHGYDCITSHDWQETRHPFWASWKLARETLPKVNWVCMMDLDILIMRQDIKLESLLNTEADLIASYDINGLNTGVVFLRNTAWCQNFLLKHWKGLQHWTNYPDQAQTACAYYLCSEPKERWEVRSQRAFNSYLYGAYNYPNGYVEGEYRQEDFALHLPALPMERRLSIFREYLSVLVP